MRDDIPQVGMTYNIMSRDGIYDLKDIAKEYHDQQQNLEKSNLCSYNRYLKNSSDARAQVCSSSDCMPNNCSIWSINHYLGLNRHPYVINKAKESLDIYGTGCGTSAMSGGHSHLHKDLQKRLAKIFGKEECLLFSTGFTANASTIATLCKGSETIILIDRDCHASIVEGCKSSGSRFLPFKHNSVTDLENKLKRYSTKHINTLVVVESAYSMEGDIAPLEKMLELKAKYNFLFYVDEAHSFGFYGKDGAGLCNELGVTDRVDFIMTTLSKSTASIGGVIATSKEFASLLKWSNAYLFQAAIPPADAVVVDACLDLIQNDSGLIQSLWDKTHYLRNKLIDIGLDVGNSESPIVPVYVRDPQILKKMETELFEQGIFTVAITYPAVKATEVRFRFIVNNSHTIQEIDNLVSILYKLGKKHKLISSSK